MSYLKNKFRNYQILEKIKHFNLFNYLIIYIFFLEKKNLITIAIYTRDAR